MEAVPGYDIYSSINCVHSMPYPTGDITRLIQANETHSPKNLLYFKGEITSVLSEFLEHSYQIPDTDVLKFTDILNDIEQNLSCSLRVSDIAQKHGWNPTVLSRKLTIRFVKDANKLIEIKKFSFQQCFTMVGKKIHKNI